MAQAQSKYQNFILRQFNGNAIDFDTDTLKGMLVSSSYTPNLTTDTFKSSITNEVTGGNYVARGQTIGSVSISNTAGTITITGNSLTWLQSATGFTNARYLVIYKDTGVDSTSPLITLVDLATNQGNVNGDLIINFNSTPTNGIIATAS